MPETIHADELANKTGFSVRHLRDVGKLGFYTSAIRSIYADRDEVLFGLVRYLRERKLDADSTKAAIEDEKLRKLKIENDTTEGLLVTKTAVAEQLEQSLTPFLAELRLKMENELPMSFSGLGVAENRIVGKRLFDDACAKISAIFLAWKI